MPAANAHGGCHAKSAMQPARPNHDTMGEASCSDFRRRNADRLVTEYQISVNTFVSGMTFRRSNSSETTAQVIPMTSTV